MRDMPPLTHSSRSDNAGDDDDNDVEFRKQFQLRQSSSVDSHQADSQSSKQYTNAKNIVHQQHCCCVYRLRTARGMVVVVESYILTLKLCCFFVVVVFCCIIIIL